MTISIGLQWDKRPRLDTWMTIYLGADDTPLNRAIGRLTLVAAVRRVRQPGCKFDQIPVLEGPEGTGKSSAIEILAGKENFSDQTILGLDDRQQQEAVRGAWLFEIADLAGMSKADVDKTKAFASRLSDRARPAYGRAVWALPRRCIFIATTNNETYLKSQTGNRRFWPVKTGRNRPRRLTSRPRPAVGGGGADRGDPSPAQVTENAVVDCRHRTGQTPRSGPLGRDTGRRQRDSVRCPNGRGQEERISTTDLLKVHLNLSADKCTDAAAKRLGYCMKRLGWEKPTDPIRIPGVNGKVRGFRRPVTTSE